MRNALTKLLIRLLDRLHSFGYEGIDTGAMHEWLLEQSLSEGFRSYWKSRDYVILKTMGQGLESKDYWIAVGQRMELLHLLGKVKEKADQAERGKKKKIDSANQ